MEYIYATLTLNELNQELNQENITAVLEAAGSDVIESRVKAIVAALEDVDIDDLGAESGIAPAPTPETEGEGDDASADSDDSDGSDGTTDKGDGATMDSDGNDGELDAGEDTESTTGGLDASLDQPETGSGAEIDVASSAADSAKAGGESYDERSETDGGASSTESGAK